MNENKNLTDNIPMKKILREKSLVEPSIRNPFDHHLTLKLADKIKIGVNSVLLLPIRLISFIIVLSTAIAVASVVTCGLSQEDLRTKPLCGWRNCLRKSLKYLGKAIGFCFGFHYIKINGKPASKEEARIFVAAPHSTFFDILVSFCIDLPCGVSRIENANIPLIGRLVKAMQPILVTREDSKNKVAVINEIKNRSDPNSGWNQLLVFPEGTCTNRSCFITFKPGGFIPALPVQPIVVQYKNKFDCVTWAWDGLDVKKILFYTLCQFHTYMEVTFLPVYHPNEKEKCDVRLFANNVRQKMADYLEIPITNHTFEDCRLMSQAKKLKLPFDTGLIEFDKLKEKLGLNYDNCQTLLDKFTLIAKKSGKINLQDFSKYLELPPTGAVEQVFKLYDRDSNGFIDFREFLIGLSLLSQPANKEETLKRAFSLFDIEDKGFVSLADLQMILYSAFSIKPDEVKTFFDKIDQNKDGLVTFDEFKMYSLQKPEYAQVFLSYHELKNLKSNNEPYPMSQITELDEQDDLNINSTQSDDNQLRNRLVDESDKPVKSKLDESFKKTD